MGVQFGKLFGIHFEHQYFADSRFTGFNITPAAERQSVFRKHGLILKPQTDGFIVLYTNPFDGNNRDRESVLKERITLHFNFQISDFAFFEYTGNLPDNLVKKNIRLSNLDRKKQVRRDSDLLHESEYVSESEIIESTETSKHFGFIEIQLDNNLKEDLYVRFLNKSIYWRYIILNENLNQFEKLAIVDKGNKKIFSGPESHVLPDGTKGIVFTSDNKIALTQKIINHFRLVVNYDERTNHFDKELISELPGPSLSIDTGFKDSIIYL